MDPQTPSSGNRAIYKLNQIKETRGVATGAPIGGQPQAIYRRTDHPQPNEGGLIRRPLIGMIWTGDGYKQEGGGGAAASASRQTLFTNNR